MIGTIVVHDAQQWNAVMCRRPQDSGSIQQIAIVLNTYRQAAVLPVRKGRAHGGGCVVADATATLAANILVMLIKGPQPQRPKTKCL